MLDEALEMKSASLYINDYTDYLSREVYSAGASEGNQPEHGKCQFRNPGGNQSEHRKRQSGEPEAGQPEDLKRSLPGKFCITFDHVKYHYSGSPEGISALDDVSVDIRNGEKIAIVGRNGAGKTTFVSLLVNLISCSGGKITLNGREMDTYGREEQSQRRKRPYM